MEKRLTKLRRVLRKDIGLRILATVLAIIIWLILSITLYPTIYSTIQDVPVVLTLEGTTAGEMGLSALDFKDLSVDVRISGMRYEIGNYTADDLVATVNVDSVKAAETYTLDINVKPRNGSDKCDVLKVSPSTVKVKFDKTSEKKVPVIVEAKNVSAADGFSLMSSKVSPNEITVSGPEKQIEDIDHAVFRVNQTASLSESWTTSNGNLYLYSTSNSVVDTTDFVLKHDPISVEFPVYYKKTMKLKFDYQGVPANFDTSILKYELSDETIDVLSPNEGVKNQEELHLGYINLSTIDLDSTFSFDIPLDSGSTIASGIKSVIVTFDKTGFSSKKFVLSDTNIKIVNVPSNLSVKLDTKQIPNVTIFGPTEIIEKMTVDDIIAEFDMQGMSFEPGSYTKSVKVYTPQIKKAWCFGTYDVVFTVGVAPIASADSPST